MLGGCCITDLDPSWECLDCHGQVYPDGLRERYTADPFAFEQARRLADTDAPR